jgi:transcriptional regulator with XRE-family HTH domain
MAMMNDKSLGEILSELSIEHGVTLEKLSELTNIPKRYLSAMAENDEKNMPAAPYVKGYIAKICATLGADPLPAMEAYRKTVIKTSGKEDFLPKNRFALAKKKTGRIVAASVAVIAIILALLPIGKRYLFAGLVGIPSIEVNLPAKVDDREFSETRDQLLVIEGKINPKDSITINGEHISVNTDGRFFKEVMLESGLNSFEIKAKRFLGQEKIIIRKVFYITENLNEEINNINNGEETTQEEQEL